MKKLISIFILLIATLVIFAQGDDFAISVKKKQLIIIDPDNMYFDSHTSRTFTIRNLPKGATVKGTFMGYDFSLKDSTIFLQPLIVYWDSDVIKHDKGYSRLTSGERTTHGQYYVAQVHIKIFDRNGIQIDSIVRNCFIKPQPYSRTSANVNRWPPYPRDTVQLNKIRKLGQ